MSLNPFKWDLNAYKLHFDFNSVNNYLTKYHLMIYVITHYSVYFIYTLFCLFLKTPQSKRHLFALTINVKYVFFCITACCSGYLTITFMAGSSGIHGIVYLTLYCKQMTCSVLRKKKIRAQDCFGMNIVLI